VAYVHSPLDDVTDTELWEEIRREELLGLLASLDAEASVRGAGLGGSQLTALRERLLGAP
jgi:hypothetical protein